MDRYETVRCDLCPHYCSLKKGATGYCRARKNEGGQIVSLTYGKWTAISLDPIEKKPLAYFYPGTKILSLGTFGCNMACPFCQNNEISRATIDSARFIEMSPEEVVQLALQERSRGNIGIAFTYNEPLINYECVMETAQLAKEAGLITVMVSAGQINPDYLEPLLPYIDAWNIDLKSFSKFAYRELGGDLYTTLKTIRMAHEAAHVEITTLVVPGISDDLEKFQEQVNYLADLDPNVPLHLTSYLPCYEYLEPATDIGLMKQMEEMAREKLTRVKLGNVR